jgi:EAL domain
MRRALSTVVAQPRPLADRRRVIGCSCWLDPTPQGGDGAAAPEAKIVSALITLAHNLKLTVTAEGVETHAQLDRLRALGCDTAQGWLFGPAGPPELITQHLAGLRPMPDKACCGRLPDFEQAHAGTRGQCGRPPPLATPRYVDHDAKCVSAGQVRCRCAVERTPRTVRSPISTRESELDSIMTASPLKPS